MDLDYLLSPYVSQEEIERRWKEYIGMNASSAIKDMESLAKEIHEKHNVPKESISCLFNRKYRTPVTEPRTWPSLKKFARPSFDGIQQMEFSDVSLVEEIMQRLRYPCIGDLKPPVPASLTYGPNNADSTVGDNAEDGESEGGSVNVWCHENSQNEDSLVNHGMYRCECFCNIPLDYFTCDTCKLKISWERHEFFRKPMVGDLHGGWGEFYCSRDCMMETFLPSEMQTLILDVVEDCTS